MSEMQGIVGSMDLLEIGERQKMRGYVRWETSEDGGSLKHCDYEVIEKTSRGTFIVKAPRVNE